MRMNNLKTTLKAAVRVVGILSFAASVAFGAPVTVNLTAGPATATLPDGSTVPMWGYTCGTVNANCAPLNSSGGWSPVVITVPTGQSLQINLTNNLSFTPVGGPVNKIPTSLVIVGQLGGGLGGTPTTTTSPTHGASEITWSTVTSGTFTPPAQGPRVQSFGTEVPAGSTSGSGAIPALVWTTPSAGTYLLESGTHPSIQGPMGLYGMVVVTAAPGATAGTETAAGTAYPGVTYDGEVPLLLSEIDPVQNNAVNAAVNTTNFLETNVWSGQPGGCGNPTSPTYQTCYPPAVNYTPLYFLVNGVAFNKTSASASMFKASPATLAPASGTATPHGLVLVRIVNAGLHMHVPAIVGSLTTPKTTPATSTAVAGFSLVAEDGNPLPGNQRVQSEVFLAAGKTYDVMINGPASTSTPALGFFSRDMSLSANAISRDAGMLAYIGINGASLPAGAAATAVANPDTYNSVIAGNTLTVSDLSKGVIANDLNVYGVKLTGAGVTHSGTSTIQTSAKGTLTLNANGTFTYAANAGWSGTDVFTYQANGSGPTTTITLAVAPVETAAGIVMGNITYNAAIAGFISITTPGVLSVDTDTAGYPLTVNVASVTTPTCAGTVYMSTDGGFNYNLNTPNSTATVCTFMYKAQNSQGTLSSAATVQINFPKPAGLAVTVVDGKTYAKVVGAGLNGQDYRWIIEEDRTFYVNPACMTNPPGTGCPSSSTIVPTFGVNFHTSDMPFVAQGCTGPKSCEAGQTVYDNTGTPCTGTNVPAGCNATYGQHINAVCDVGNGVCRPDTTGNGRTWVSPSQVALDATKRYYISVLPGDAADPFYGGSIGHGMGGAPITFGQTAVTVLSQASPYPPAKLSVMVFEDDFPLNGEQDAGGGVDVLAPLEPGLGNFQIHLWDAMGGNGDFTGQMTYDMFNQPLTNSLAGTIDPTTGEDACPISPGSSATFNGATGSGGVTASATGAGNTISVAGITVDPSQVGNTVVITSGSGFTPGTYTVASVSVANKTWTLTPANPATTATTGAASGMKGYEAQPGITGMIVTCPYYEADKQTPSPLAGQALIANLMPGRFGVVATPGADRIARGEEWLQTNTLDGQKAHDSFVKINEPSYFQEYGPANYHVTIGFANPAIINARLASVCTGTDAYLPGQTCSSGNKITGRIVGERLSRSPDERLYGSGSHDTYYWTQSYVSVGDPDGEDFAFTKCAADGTFTITGIPYGNWRVTSFDQWNDQLVDGLSTPVALTAANPVVNMGDIAATQWQADLYTRTFIDDNHTGVYKSGEAGVPLIPVTVRLRDGSLENNLVTDFTGTANFNETFPLFSWYVVETDVTRYKDTGTHVVYDVGGPADQSPSCGQTGYPPCGTSTIGKFLANTAEQVSVPTGLRVPGAIYCATADCIGSTETIKNWASALASSAVPSSCTMNGTGAISCSTILSSGRIDPPFTGNNWTGVEGWQGFPGQNNFLEFGKIPYATGENGGISGHVVYASTRPFDDPQMLVQTQWEPLVPHVTINLYQETTAPDGSQALTLFDHTQTSSFDDWAQGFRADGITPNMSCPGQWTTDLFYFTLYQQPNYLNAYNYAHGTGPALNSPPLPDNSQFKCYDGMHNWNQLQPAPYDGMYHFPSVTAVDANGRPSASNCTACTTDTTPSTDPNYDAYYAGLPMLPIGKYVVEVVMPAGYELVKEEDKNILIGDNFIAPVSQEFGALGNIFILPDQAAIGSTYNANNAQNPTQGLGAVPRTEAVPVFPFEQVWPCVGQLRVVPDFISLYPQSQQVSPFAGAYRHLCDRKEVTLADQMGATAKFYVYTSTHKAAKFTGGITDDFTSEFDPFSPQFGEKFAPPDLPVAVRDWTGAEISRVYADQWGAYNGMTYSTWEVNPPNPTGYAPTMMVFCMNDPGPMIDGTTAKPIAPGNIVDPQFVSSYSQFCYELPFMPGTTQYLDTPVVPTAAFSEGYNHPDCAEPALTPAISEVDGDGVGPWVSATGPKTLTIKSLGTVNVANYGYSGPAATTSPYNQRTVPRHYGFGATQGTGTVTIGGKAATVTAWSDTQITATAPSGVPNCAVQQLATYGGSTAQCGELVITTGTGQQSVDTVTVTIGGKAPTYVSGSVAMSQDGPGSIQQAINAAKPGDLIMIPAGTYYEMLIMWKPVRLQGVGAASTTINANTQPAGKLDPWRRQVNCLFGLAINGQPYTGSNNIPSSTNTNPYDSTGNYSCPGNGWVDYTGGSNNPQVDRIALEGIVGWDASVNGNLAQMLQEPSLMGAYEGAGITVVAKGVQYPANGPYVFGNGPDSGTVASEGQFPLGTRILTNSTADCKFPSNFQCNPSAIDGLSVTDASQGGGGIFLHGWVHNIQIANNRVYNNIGTLSGGINVGQGETPDALLAGNNGEPLAPTGGFDQQPWTCLSGAINPDGSQNPNPPGYPNGVQLPFCLDLNVNVHNNSIIQNTSIGDELFSGTPAGAGGISFTPGSDYYKFTNNWVCGNMSTGDGGGVSHLGFSLNGDIEHNTIIFNQSTNPTIATNGGGLIVMGTAPDGSSPTQPECGSTVSDVDCPPGLSDGTGPGLVINANLIMGNAAESGSGGGLRFQAVNGTEVSRFYNTPSQWYSVTVTNNIITNNVAGWDGAGVSLSDALAVNMVNNTVASNDSTASAGPLFNTLGSPNASAPGATNQCGNSNCTASQPQPAGLVSMPNSSVLTASFTGLPPITCPANHAGCAVFSNPYLANDLFWQNRSYYIAVGSLSPQYQQNILTLFNSPVSSPGVPAPTQATTGQCTTASYWDLGVRGDTGPGNHASGHTLGPVWSALTSATENGTGTNNLTATNPNFVSQYCNGSRVPPENGGPGWQVPPGIADATVPNPIFSLTPVATVDEGNNWVNIQWGPLALTSPATNAVLGNYALASTSTAIDHIPTTASTYSIAPTFDFFGNPRPDAKSTAIDIGAVEYQGGTSSPAVASVTGGPLAFGNVPVGTTSAALTLTLHNTGGSTLTGIAVSFASARYARAAGTCGTGTFTLAAASTCTITVTFSPTATGLVSSTVSFAASVTVTGSPVTVTGTGAAAVRSATLTPAPYAFAAQTRNCPGTGLGIIACLADPTHAFTLTNTGNVPLTGIGQAAFATGGNPSDFAIVRALSNCGPTGNGQLVANATLAPAATCTVTVQFKPVTTEAAGSKTITLQVTDVAGTQASVITGQAN
jgi:hypothetical protein